MLSTCVCVDVCACVCVCVCMCVCACACVQCCISEPVVQSEFLARVGTRSEVNCTTPDSVAVDAMSWRNSTGGVVAMVTDAASVGLVFAPPAPSDDGVAYECRMSDGIRTATTIRLRGEDNFNNSFWRPF